MSPFIGAIVYGPEPGQVRRFPAAFRVVDGKIVSTAPAPERGDCVGCLFRPVFTDGFGDCRFLGEIVLAERKYWDCIGRRITACVHRQDNGDPGLTARQALENSIRGTLVERPRKESDASGGGAGGAVTVTAPADRPDGPAGGAERSGSPSRAVRPKPPAAKPVQLGLFG